MLYKSTIIIFETSYKGMEEFNAELNEFFTDNFEFVLDKFIPLTERIKSGSSSRRYFLVILKKFEKGEIDLSETDDYASQFR